MDEEFAVLLFFFGISLTANLAFIIGAFRSARRIGRLENRVFGGAGSDEGRVERLEQAVESMEARLDQLARGQEFLSRLVSERRQAIVPRHREVTPV
jgi:hypothetical protein